MNNLRILLVEDLAICEIAALTLLRASLPNVLVDVARSGSEAIEYASKNNYVLILMDIGLPDMYGYEAAAKIRELKPNAPIIALTSHDIFTIQDDCLRAGIKKIITKPLTEKELSATIKQWMKQPSKNNVEQEAQHGQAL